MLYPFSLPSFKRQNVGWPPRSNEFGINFEFIQRPYFKKVRYLKSALENDIYLKTNTF